MQGETARGSEMLDTMNLERVQPLVLYPLDKHPGATESVSSVQNSSKPEIQ